MLLDFQNHKDLFKLFKIDKRSDYNIQKYFRFTLYDIGYPSESRVMSDFPHWPCLVTDTTT